MKLKNDHIIVDLGAGSGTVIFAAADEAHKKGLNTEFVAIDINFLLVVYMYIKAQFHPHKAHIHIMQGDLFKMDYEKMIQPFKHATFYMYAVPWLANALAQLVVDINKPAQILSYYYPVSILKQKDKLSGEHEVFEYEVK